MQIVEILGVNGNNAVDQVGLDNIVEGIEAEGFEVGEEAREISSIDPNQYDSVVDIYDGQANANSCKIEQAFEVLEDDDVGSISEAAHTFEDEFESFDSLLGYQSGFSILRAFAQVGRRVRSGNIYNVR